MIKIKNRNKNKTYTNKIFIYLNILKYLLKKIHFLSYFICLIVYLRILNIIYFLICNLCIRLNYYQNV
jgi:hypothetical protein